MRGTAGAPAHSGRWTLLIAAFAVLAVGLTAGCGGDDDRADSLEVSNARAQFTTTDLGAVYFDIRSTGAGDVLVAASSPIADDVQVHEVVREGGSAMMRPVEGGIAIAPGGRVALESGGYHVMLLGVVEIPEAGATFEVVLEFERAGRMTITVEVLEFGAEDGGDGMEHGEMEDEGMEQE